MSTYYVLVLYTHSHFILMTTLQGRLTNEETEGQNE